MTRLKADWLQAPPLQRVFDALAGGDTQLFLVGGCVRDGLLGRPTHDLDLATDLLPEQVIQRATAAGLKAVPTGIEHGTVTLICDGQTAEVTTFRKDIATDGRHAKVVFGQDLAEDARRRDFTINALYADRFGALTDPLGGLADLQARQVRFVGAPALRIREDYLRSLRFFRFYARFGDPGQGPDPDALAAIAGNLEGLAILPAERITAELVKLFETVDPAPATAAMRSTGVLAAVLPGVDDQWLAPLVDQESAAAKAPLAARRLAVLGAPALLENLRLSKAQRRRVQTLHTAACGSMPPAELGYRMGRKTAIDAMMVRNAFTSTPWQSQIVDRIDKGADATFPVTAADLMDRFHGPALGQALADLETAWIASDFRLDKSTLLARL